MRFEVRCSVRCLVEQGQARTGIERQPGSLLMLAGTTHAALTRPGPGDVAALSFHSGSLCFFYSFELVIINLSDRLSPG